MRRYLRPLAALLLTAFTQAAAWAADARVAVAANFAEPMKALAAELKATTGHTLAISLGSTGKLYAQIQNGAPFDVLLAADAKTPALLEQTGQALPGSRFTYATGQLALWSARPGRVDAQGAVLRAADLGRVAYAAPKVAPYGAAAVEVMERLGLSAALAPRLVQGESIGQAFNFVFTGNADVGFVALSQVWVGGRLRSGSVWRVPPELYSPIRQDAVVLQRGANNAAALALVKLLQTPRGRALVASYGYL
jgi:molybdate transport system substrate-binding protein